MAILRSRLTAMANAVDQEIAEQALSETAEAIIQIIRFTAPVDTGLLRSSFEKRQKSPSALYVGSEVPYAPYVEFGTYRMAGRPFFLSAFVRGQGILRNKASGRVHSVLRRFTV